MLKNLCFMQLMGVGGIPTYIPATIVLVVLGILLPLVLGKILGAYYHKTRTHAQLNSRIKAVSIFEIVFGCLFFISIILIVLTFFAQLPIPFISVSGGVSIWGDSIIHMFGIFGVMESFMLAFAFGINAAVFGSMRRFGLIEYILQAEQQKNLMIKEVASINSGIGKYRHLSQAEKQPLLAAANKKLNAFSLNIDIDNLAKKYRKKYRAYSIWEIGGQALRLIWVAVYLILVKFKKINGDAAKNNSGVGAISDKTVHYFDGRIFQSFDGKIIGYAREDIFYNRQLYSIGFGACNASGQKELYNFEDEKSYASVAPTMR